MTQKSMPTRYYSDLQETRIARALGWQRVVASGARSFHPGDIKSDQWLGECKTHIKSQNKIVFKLSEWEKIQTEATSVMKIPVLFVDNGTQDLSNTWVMINDFYLPLHNSILVRIPSIPHHVSATKIWFEVERLMYSYSVEPSNVSMIAKGNYPYYLIKINDGRSFAIMRFDAFKKQFIEEL